MNILVQTMKQKMTSAYLEIGGVEVVQVIQGITMILLEYYFISHSLYLHIISTSHLKNSFSEGVGLALRVPEEKESENYLVTTG